LKSLSVSPAVRGLLRTAAVELHEVCGSLSKIGRGREVRVLVFQDQFRQPLPGELPRLGKRDDRNCPSVSRLRRPLVRYITKKLSLAGGARSARRIRHGIVEDSVLRGIAVLGYGGKYL